MIGPQSNSDQEATRRGRRSERVAALIFSHNQHISRLSHCFVLWKCLGSDIEDTETQHKD